MGLGNRREEWSPGPRQAPATNGGGGSLLGKNAAAAGHDLRRGLKSNLIDDGSQAKGRKSPIEANVDGVCVVVEVEGMGERHAEKLGCVICLAKSRASSAL